MEVLIVSKTQMRESYCVGGLVLATNQNVRLLNRGNRNQPTDTDFEIGQVWRIKFIPRNPSEPPHIEDIIVLEKRLIGKEHDIAALLHNRNLVNWKGNIDETFDGQLEWTGSGSGYVVPQSNNLPEQSVGFWVADRDLTSYTSWEKQRYRYPSDKGPRNFRFVGLQPMEAVIPSGTIIRLSLTRAFETSDKRGLWLQLSGWY